MNTVNLTREPQLTKKIIPEKKVIYAHRDNKAPIVHPLSTNSSAVPVSIPPQIHQGLPHHGIMLGYGQCLEER